MVLLLLVHEIKELIMGKRCFIIVILSMLFICSCSPYRKQNSSSTQQTGTFPVYIREQLDTHIFVNADISKVDSDKYYIYKAKRYAYSAEELMNAFEFDQNTVTLVQYNEDEFCLKNGDRRVDSFGTLYYSQGAFRSGYYVALQDMSFLYKLSEEVEFGENLLCSAAHESERIKAIEKTKGLADRLNIAIGDLPRIGYYIAAASIENALHKRFTDEGMSSIPPQLRIKDTWEDDEDCIYMIWDILYDNIPLISGNYSLSRVYGLNSQEAGSSLIVFYNNEELIGMDLTVYYEPIEIVDSKDVLVSINTVLDAIKYQFRNTILDSDIIFTDIKLCYVPVLKDNSLQIYHLVPAWVVWGTRKIEGEYGGHSIGYLIKVNALNGEIIY